MEGLEGWRDGGSMSARIGSAFEKSGMRRLSARCCVHGVGVWRVVDVVQTRVGASCFDCK